MLEKNYLNIKEQISNKKVVKAILADLYFSDVKLKNLLCIVLDSGIVDQINQKNSLSKMDTYRFKKILIQQYGTNADDGILAIKEWSNILGVKVEADEKSCEEDFLLFSKELIQSMDDSVINKVEIEKNAIDIISYAYILSDQNMRNEIIYNCVEFFDKTEENIKKLLFDKIIKINADDFIKRNINQIFSLILFYVTESIEQKNAKIVNIKCFLGLKILKTILVTILYRDGKVNLSICLIFITALFHANEHKLTLSGAEDDSIESIIMSFPEFNEVIQYREQCADEEFCDFETDALNEKCRSIYEAVKVSILDNSITEICNDVSTIFEDYVISKLKIEVTTNKK